MKDTPVITEKKYPDGPITIIVPTGPGGSPDLMARAMEKAAMKYLGYPLVVKNIPGGAATIGWNELAGSKPDGYTIGVTTTGIILQPLYGPTRYHYPTALEPLAEVGTLPIVLAVRSDQPWESIDDVVKYAQEHPGEIKYAHPGLGAPTHIVAEMFAKAAGIDIKQVPFVTATDAVGAFLGGHVQLLFMSTPELKEQIRSGRVRVLAVAAEQRLTDDPELQKVPTFKEQGLDVVFNLWHGIGAPKMMPKDVQDRLAEGLRNIVNEPEFKENMSKIGLTVKYLGPQECSERWMADNARLTKFVKESGIAERIAAQKN
ncbi:MAG TPA: tripartite tricarboxylate transporter substrate binding protein [Methylomusa anaerophila]|nr:tripartite tricarboxylate transporter substrate binding protein [Methylomusa anaerophila]HML89788.1 tripartite tricarboxylate transporter substrate binding protein [Methylomusa anaerophila]